MKTVIVLLSIILAACSSPEPDTYEPSRWEQRFPWDGSYQQTTPIGFRVTLDNSAENVTSRIDQAFLEVFECVGANHYPAKPVMIHYIENLYPTIGYRGFYYATPDYYFIGADSLDIRDGASHWVTKHEFVHILLLEKTGNGDNQHGTRFWECSDLRAVGV